ncbi:MAG: DnaB-like helicase C-terminal domain-containing protein [Candidatus Phytoplasma stylosanthis]|nr:DnaB-like helicase C-terminal domain-containing protein [Candidatus Phytoplasma stylosanthis]
MKEQKMNLTNEQQALTQMLEYIQKRKWDILKIYTAIIEVQYLKEPKHQKIFNGLKYVFCDNPTIISEKILIDKDDLVEELLVYLQEHFPQDHFQEDDLNFLKVKRDGNFHFLENLKHTYNQKQLFQQLMSIIRPSYEQKDPFTENLYYKEIFSKLKHFVSLLPSDNDKNLYSCSELNNLHPELFSADKQAQQKIQEEYYRLSPQFVGLNEATRGFKKGQIITIGGATGLGKTSFMYNLLLNLTQKKYEEKSKYPHLLLFSYEMTSYEQVSRSLAIFTGLPLNVILEKDFRNIELSQYEQKMEDAHNFFQKINQYTSFDTTKKIDYALQLIYRLHLEQKVEIVVFDHLQIMKGTNDFDNDRLVIDEIMTKLKKIAVDLNIVIIILSQFSRYTSHHPHGQSPRISALKGSGGIETNSDIVFLMAKFNPNIDKENQKPVQCYTPNLTDLYQAALEQTNLNQIMEINIKKNRSGQRKTLLYHFNPLTQIFTEVGFVPPYKEEI